MILTAHSSYAGPELPQTKGKDENANKFMNWLLPYDHEIESG